MWRPQLSKNNSDLLSQSGPKYAPNGPQSHHQVDKMDPDLVNCGCSGSRKTVPKAILETGLEEKKETAPTNERLKTNWGTAVWRSQLNYNSTNNSNSSSNSNNGNNNNNRPDRRTLIVFRRSLVGAVSFSLPGRFPGLLLELSCETWSSHNSPKRGSFL